MLYQQQSLRLVLLCSSEAPYRYCVSAQCAYMILTTKNYKNKRFKNNIFDYRFLSVQNTNVVDKILSIAKTGCWQSNVLLIL